MQLGPHWEKSSRSYLFVLLHVVVKADMHVACVFVRLDHVLFASDQSALRWLTDWRGSKHVYPTSPSCPRPARGSPARRISQASWAGLIQCPPVTSASAMLPIAHNLLLGQSTTNLSSTVSYRYTPLCWFPRLPTTVLRCSDAIHQE